MIEVSKRTMDFIFFPLPLSPSALTKNMEVGMSHSDTGEGKPRTSLRKSEKSGCVTIQIFPSPHVPARMAGSSTVGRGRG
jgi:hypothetical protein